MTGATPGLPAGGACSLAGRLGQVEGLVADQTDPTKTQPPIARRRLDPSGRGMPVEPDQPLTFASPDHHLQALHRHEQLQRLDPLCRDTQGVITAQIVELGPIFFPDRLHPKRLASAIGIRPLSVTAGEVRQSL